MNTEKRLMLAVGLSALIIIAYQAYMRQYIKPQVAPGDIACTIPAAAVETKSSPSTMQANVPQRAVNEQPAKQVMREHTVTLLGNDMFALAATTDTAGVQSMVLADYYDKDCMPHEFNQRINENRFFLTTAFLMEPVANNWQIVFARNNTVQYEARTQNAQIVKTIELRPDSYVIDVTLDIRNLSTHDIDFQYKIYNGMLETARGHMDSRYLGADILIDNKITRMRPSSKTINGEILAGSSSWAATRGRYFTFIIKPAQEVQSAFIQSNTKNDLYTGLISKQFEIKTHQNKIHYFSVYAGPNKIDYMQTFDSTTKDVIHYGVFNAIGRLLFSGLKMSYKLTHNYGLAIIMLSFLISLIMLPLTRKSMHSMKEMQRIQPETELIRKQYADNPQKMNKEIMELYKKHKINPVGGCLPMLLQMPIFFSLYQVLLRSVELKGAGFLWIKDLAEPDAAFALPQALKNLPLLGGNINILPILMAIAMAFQQRLSQGGVKKMSEQQRMMAGIMPIMFGLIFYNMPSGLVLYWFTNTLFMLFAQEFVLKSRLCNNV